MPPRTIKRFHVFWKLVVICLFNWHYISPEPEHSRSDGGNKHDQSILACQGLMLDRFCFSNFGKNLSCCRRPVHLKIVFTAVRAELATSCAYRIRVISTMACRTWSLAGGTLYKITTWVSHFPARTSGTNQLSCLPLKEQIRESWLKLQFKLLV